MIMQENPTSLRELCINALATSEISSDEIRKKLQLFEQVGDKDDLVYAIMLELHILHGEQDLRLQSEIKRDEVYHNRLQAMLELQHKQMLALVVRQQVIYRQQFRRLIAIHREKFANKLVFTVCVLLLGLLSGIGVFHLYRLF